MTSLVKRNSGSDGPRGASSSRRKARADGSCTGPAGRSDEAPPLDEPAPPGGAEPLLLGTPSRRARREAFRHPRMGW